MLDPKFSLTPSSDAVALMIFADQMRMMNLPAYPDKIDELGITSYSWTNPPLPGPIRGSSGFAERFSSAGPRDSKCVPCGSSI